MGRDWRQQLAGDSIQRYKIATARPERSIRPSRRARSLAPLFATLLLLIALSACQQVDDPQIRYDPAALAFSGERAHELQRDFVNNYPNRASGQPNNALAAVAIKDHLLGLGWRCTIDQWTEINDSRELPLNNVLCALPGRSEQTIVVLAHFDQSPETVQGADNNASGVSLMLHLAELLSAEEPLPYTLQFVASDGAPYGLLGARRFVSTEHDLDQIVAAFSLDGLGKEFYNGLEMSTVGQFRGVGPLWLQKVARESARAAGDVWAPQVRPLWTQLLGQAAPIPFTDQGPLIAAGVPAIGLSAVAPAGSADLLWETSDSPLDTIELQSPAVLQNGGRAAEALIRQLNTMEEFPSERGPYLYDQGSDRVLHGPLLWLLFIAFCALFLGLAVRATRRQPLSFEAALRVSLPHLAGLWLPIVGGVLLLYVFVLIGLLDTYAVYPASPKDADLVDPRWLVVALWLVGLLELFQIGRRLAGLYMADRPLPSFAQVRILALTVIGVGAFYVLVKNPFSLVLMLPLLFWIFIGGRSGIGRVFDWLLFLGGGLLLYLLAYYFGFQVLRIDLAILWYAMMMLAIGMISFPTSLVIAAVLAAGLSLVVNPPIGRRRTEAQKTRNGNHP